MDKENLKKENLIKNLSSQTGFSNSLSKKLVNDFIEILINNIKNSELTLQNFGSFRTINKKKRLGRNPKTREEFIISSRKSISFTVSKKILNDLNPL